LKAVIVDEAHHAAAPSYRHILSHFNSGIKSPHAVEGSEDGVLNPAVSPPKHSVPIIGFSATFSRHDGLALGSVFDRIVYHRDFLEMIKEQWSYICSDPALVRTDVDSGIGYAMCDLPASGQI
jgi:ATP-dependent helicase IRC3